MKRKISFILILLIGTVAISLSFYLFWNVDKIAEFVAIYVAGSTAVYTILAEQNPVKTEKQQIYGQLKGIIKNIITILKKRNYHRFSFGLWDNIQQDHRYEMFDEKFAKRLDAFLESTGKYSDIIAQLDYAIIPKIVRETVIEIFHEEPNEENTSPASLDVIDTKAKSQNYHSVNVVDDLKEQVEFSDVISRALGKNIETTEMSGIETEVRFRKIDPNEAPFKSRDFKEIAKFWDASLRKVRDTPEQQFVVKENENLLTEANGIKEELIKRIKKSIET